MLQLSEVKEYLRIDDDAEDEYINTLIMLASEICENYMRQAIPEDIPKSCKQAMLLCIGYFFENRNGTKEGLPTVVYTLLEPYRKAVF